ncbi:MFS transporter [Sphaerisporangium corydalis]|uniref:MFS transporter n=1 Tax=Sphaerisporangium corydalis TaxID=1441875 RepID=A0ABV9E817_9ACTN|nr:MFS transporter [Sphaerisporangium corydalis]
MIESPPEAPPGVLSRPYRALSIGMVALVLLLAFEYLAVATAMPVVARALDGLPLYGLAFSGSMAAGVLATVAGGRWSDARGPVGPMWTGVAGFTAGLLIAGLAPTMHVLIIGRFVQGIGGGLFSVALYVVVAQVYPPIMHPKVFSLLAAAWVLPSIVGPAITGAVVEHIGWRWIFLGIPIFVAPAAVMLWRGLAGLSGPSVTAPVEGDAEAAPSAGGAKAVPPAGGAKAIPSAPAEGGAKGVPSQRGFGARLAWGGVVAVGAALLQYGSGLGGRGLVLLAAGLVILVFALPRLLPTGTMRAGRGFPTVVLLRGLAAGASFAADVFVPLMLTGERGLSPTLAGLFLTGSALSWSLASWIQGRGKYDRTLLLRVGTAMLALGIAGTGLLVFDAVPVLAGLGAWLVAGFGIGLVYPTLSVLTLELSEPGEEGRNSSSLQIGESVFAVVIIAATGAVFAGFDTARWVYLVCFGLIVLPAALGIFSAHRVQR